MSSFNLEKRKEKNESLVFEINGINSETLSNKELKILEKLLEDLVYALNFQEKENILARVYHNQKTNSDQTRELKSYLILNYEVSEEKEKLLEIIDYFNNNSENIIKKNILEFEQEKRNELDKEKIFKRLRNSGLKFKKINEKNKLVKNFYNVNNSTFNFEFIKKSIFTFNNDCVRIESEKQNSYLNILRMIKPPKKPNMLEFESLTHSFDFDIKLMVDFTKINGNFRYNLYLILEEMNEHNLKEKTRNVLSFLNSEGIEFEKANDKKSFNKIFPLNINLEKNFLLTYNGFLKRLLPIFDVNCGINEGKHYYINRNREVVALNHFKEDTKNNILIQGKSGSGKTHLTQRIIKKELEEGNVNIDYFTSITRLEDKQLDKIKKNTHEKYSYPDGLLEEERVGYWVETLPKLITKIKEEQNNLIAFGDMFLLQEYREKYLNVNQEKVDEMFDLLKKLLITANQNNSVILLEDQKVTENKYNLFKDEFGCVYLTSQADHFAHEHPILENEEEKRLALELKMGINKFYEVLLKSREYRGILKVEF